MDFLKIDPNLGADMAIKSQRMSQAPLVFTALDSRPSPSPPPPPFFLCPHSLCTAHPRRGRKAILAEVSDRRTEVKRAAQGPVSR